MKYTLTVLLFIVVFVCVGYASSVNITVGTSDPNTTYATIGAAIAAINAGSVVDGNGDAADSVTIVLMDSVYNESELLLKGHNGQPRNIGVITGHPVAGGGTNVVVNISPIFGTGIGWTVENVESFTISNVQMNLDTSSPWDAGVDLTLSGVPQFKMIAMETFNLMAPTSKKGIVVHADSGGNFAMENCTLVAQDTAIDLSGNSSCGAIEMDGNSITAAKVGIKKKVYNVLVECLQNNRIVHNNFSHCAVCIEFDNMTARTIEINGNTFDSVGAAIVMDSVNADTVKVEGNNLTILPELDAIKNEISIETIEIAHHGIDVCSIRKNKIKTVQEDSAMVGISLDGIREGVVRVDSNIIDMGGSGTALSIIKRSCLASFGVDDVQISVLSTQIVNASKGIDITLDHDTTGLGLPLDSLTFGDINVSGNNVTVCGSQSCAIWVPRYNDPKVIPLYQLDLVIQRTAHISRNTITVCSSDNSVGILSDAIHGIVTNIDSNIIDMGGNGTAIKQKVSYAWTVTPTQVEDKYEFSLNTISHAGTGIDIEFDSSNVGNLPVDSLKYRPVEISDNVINVAGNGKGFVIYREHENNGHGQGNINSVKIKRNTLSADPLPGGDVGISIDDSLLTACSMEVDSNSINGFRKGLDIRESVCYCKESPFMDVSDNIIVGPAPITPKVVISGPSSVGSCDNLTLDLKRNHVGGGGLIDIGVLTLNIQDNSFTNSAGDGLLVKVTKNDNDTSKVLLENNTLSNNGGDGTGIHTESGAGFIDVTIAGNTFSGNTGSGLRGYPPKSEFGNGNKFGFDKGHGHNNIIEPLAAKSKNTLLGLMENSLPNSFINNGGNGLQLDSAIHVPDGIHYQNFSGNGGYNLFNGTTENIDVTGCWWGTTDSVTIAMKIFDGNDSAGLGSMDFIPYLVDSVLSTLTSAEFSLNDGWNLSSLPVGVADNTTSSLFPTAVSHAFTYAGSYHTVETIDNGVGFWIKSGTAHQQTISGLTIASDSIDVVPGWNLVGSISTPVAVNQIASLPPGLSTSEFFGYDGSYQIADSILPGHGYWVRVESAGKLILSSSAGPTNSPRAIRIIPSNEQPPSAPANGFSDKHQPKEFSLKQNYPNPFNPSTHIGVDLPMSSIVTLKVYNMIGQEVAAPLIDRRMDGGTYAIEFNASNLPSGMYMYRLTARSDDRSTSVSNFSDVRKMLLIK